jgi:hypothetical protein
MSDDATRHTPGPGWSRPATDSFPEASVGEASPPAEAQDAAIRAIVGRLARRHPSGGTVIERAAILAEGADCTAVVAWIIAHEGEPEAALASTARRGLHSPRLSDPAGAGSRPPLRYVLPAGALA